MIFFEKAVRFITALTQNDHVLNISGQLKFTRAPKPSDTFPPNFKFQDIFRVLEHVWMSFYKMSVIGAPQWTSDRGYSLCRSCALLHFYAGAC